MKAKIKKWSDCTEFQTSIEEILRSNPTLWDDLVRDDIMYDIKEQAAVETVCQQLLQNHEQLHRILVARNFDSLACEVLFWRQSCFRAHYFPIKPSQIPTALSSGVMRLCGYTKDGHVLCTYKLYQWDPQAYGENFDNAVDEYIRYICYMMESMIGQSSKQSKFCFLFDLKGFYASMVIQTRFRAMIGELISVAQEQYPERLQCVYLVNVPWGFDSAWSLIKLLLDSKTASKIKFCSKLDRLLEDIDEEILTTEYGGTHDEYPLPT